MGSFCVLCGEKVGLLDRFSYSLFQTKQTLCPQCMNQISALSGPALEEKRTQMLASPHLEEADKVRAYAALSRPCPMPDCDGRLECEKEGVLLGREGLLYEEYSVDIFACPRCGKVELFTAGTVRRAMRPKQEEKPAAPTVFCPVCGARHEEGKPCPACAADLARQSAKPARTAWRRGEKPPWEK